MNAWDRLLVVASDKTSAHGSARSHGLKGREGLQYYEGGVRVPLVVSGGYLQ